MLQPLPRDLYQLAMYTPAQLLIVAKLAHSESR